MNITKIELHNFRNYKELKIDKFSNLNIIIGSNGIGKTSILESIYIGSLAKTFKSNDDNSVIMYGKDSSKIKIKFYSEFLNKELEIIFSKDGKKTKINDTIQKRLSDFISQYKIILFSPDELKIIKSSPNVRRNYLNIQISQLHKEYINILNNYNILIKNKNEFLKKLMLNSNLDTKYLDLLDIKLSECGLVIYNYRKDYIKLINRNINKIFNNFNKKDIIEIKYLSDFENCDEEKIVKLLKKNRFKDINLGLCNIGIHRDDYEFMQNGMSSKEYSSQGTQKLILLSMKLSEIELFKNNYGYDPIILLDDLFSELDNKNINKIFNVLNDKFQTFITTTDIKNINKKIVDKAKIYNIDERKYV